MTKELKLIKNRYLNRLIERTKRACSRIGTLCVCVCACDRVFWKPNQFCGLSFISSIYTNFISFLFLIFFCFVFCGSSKHEYAADILLNNDVNFICIHTCFLFVYFSFVRHTYTPQYGFVRKKNSVFSSSSALHHWYCSPNTIIPH